MKNFIQQMLEEFRSTKWYLNTVSNIPSLEERLGRELTKQEVDNASIIDLFGETTLANATLEPIERFFTQQLKSFAEECIKLGEEIKEEVFELNYQEYKSQEDYQIEYHEQTLRIGFNQALTAYQDKLREIIK